MKESELIKNSKDRISDEEFLKKYDTRKKRERDYKKYKSDKKSSDLILNTALFSVVFIISYYLFTNFLFSVTE